MLSDREWVTSLTARTVGGSYRLGACLGIGGMGAVLMGEHLELGRRVAIKVLRPSLAANPDLRERLRREGRAMAELRHPNIASVIDYGSDPDIGVYLVMEYLEGESLQRRLAAVDGPMTLGQSLSVVDQVLDAMIAIHAGGFVHRDLTPSNIFLVDSGAGAGRVKILDFGITKVMGNRWETLTTQGIALGTPAYMASEQAKGLGDVDHRADICAVGRVLRRCLSGAETFDRKSGLDLLRLVAVRAPEPIHRSCPGLHPALCAVIDQANALDREHRFQSADAFRRALHHATNQARDGGADFSRTVVDVDVVAESSTERLPAVQEPASNLIGDRYELLEPLAEGGMGAVYRARHVVSRRLVALKIIHSHLTTDPEVVKRFQQEARIVSNLSHPGLVEILDAGVDTAGRCFLAMELLVGESLANRMSDRPMDIDEALRIFAQLAEALAVLHAAGIVHQDLKPLNVFVAREHDLTERVKLLDFGITRPSGSANPGELVGTPLFMAPERIDSSAAVEPTSDVWSVGVMLYRAVTGRLPFEGERLMDVLARVVHADHVPVLHDRSDCDVGLAQLIESCLQKDSTRRPRDGRAVRDALRDLVDQRTQKSPADSMDTLGSSAVHRTSSRVASSPATFQTSTRHTTAFSSNETNRGKRVSSAVPLTAGIGVVLAIGAAGVYLMVRHAPELPPPPKSVAAEKADAGIGRSTPTEVLQQLIEETPEDALHRGEQALLDGRYEEAEAAFRRVFRDPSAAPDVRAKARIGEGERQMQRVEHRLRQFGAVEDDQELSDLWGSLQIHLLTETVFQFEHVAGAIFPLERRAEPLEPIEGVSSPVQQCARLGIGNALVLLVNAGDRLAGSGPEFGEQVTHPRLTQEDLDLMARHLILADHNYRLAMEEPPPDGACYHEARQKRQAVRQRLRSWSGRNAIVDQLFPAGLD